MKCRIIATLGMLALVLLFSTEASPQHRNSERLVLSLERPDEKGTEILPGSRLYAAELFNNTDKTVKLQAIKMHGEYQGTSKSFNCTLEVWSEKWITIWTEKTPALNIADVQVRPGEHMRVCNLLLPSQAGQVGQCVRFRLRTLWRHGISQILVSKPFVIGDTQLNGGPAVNQSNYECLQIYLNVYSFITRTVSL